MLVPIRSITRKSTGDTFEFTTDGPGEACQRLLQALLEVQKGKVKADAEWLWQVSPVPNVDGVENPAS